MAASAPPPAKTRSPGANDPRLPHVLVMGAGLVGGFVGGHLQAAGARVDLVGRPRMLQALAGHGLALTDLDGGHTVLPAADLRLHATVPEGLAPDLTLLCVKAVATAEAMTELAARLPAGSTVLVLQNGIQGADLAQRTAPGLQVLRGMVPFNVAAVGPGQLHRGTSGRLAAQEHAALLPWLPTFEAAGLPLDLHADMLPLQWSKLLLNLNNAVNALSGMPLRAQLLDRDLRHCTAALIAETLHLLRASGIRPRRLGGVRPQSLPWVLRLPTPLFRLLARRLLKIDARARSSMADDLMLRRTPEVDALHGEVLRLAASRGQLAPCNARMIQLVKAWSPRSSPLSGRAMRKFLNV